LAVGWKDAADFYEVGIANPGRKERAVKGIEGSNAFGMSGGKEEVPVGFCKHGD